MRVDLAKHIYTKIRENGHITYSEIDAEILMLYTSAALLRAGATSSKSSFARRYRQCLPISEEENMKLLKLGAHQLRYQFVYNRTRGTHPILKRMGDRLCFTEVGLKVFGQKT